LFALDFNPFLLYQQCATTLQHDSSGLLPWEAAAVLAEKPNLSFPFPEHDAVFDIILRLAAPALDGLAIALC